jgi:hypothetical protein
LADIVWTAPVIEDLNAVAETLVDLPDPKTKKKYKFDADIS